MRSIPANLNTELIKTHGVEAITVVEILWNPDGNRFKYADRDTSFASGKILAMSDLDFVIDVNSGSDSAEISLVLDDVDGSIKSIMDTVDVHKKQVWVYQYVEGTTYPDDRALVFTGEISSPIVWKEGQRSVQFSVISQIEDQEVGFSIEEGKFIEPDPELIGEPWPLKFGTTIRVPALRLQTPLKGTLATSVGIKDFTLNFQKDAWEALPCPLVFDGYHAEYGGPLGQTLIITPLYVQDPGCVNTRCNRIRFLENQIEKQSKYEFKKIRIIDGDKFPQGEVITLNINGGKFTGVMNGNVFTIQNRRHPDFVQLTDAYVQSLIDEKKEEQRELCSGYFERYESDGTFVDLEASGTSRNFLISYDEQMEFINAIPKSNFFWAPGGTTVELDSGDEIIYISNILEETVHQVQAYKELNGVKRLVAVPPSFYTVRTQDYTNYTVTEIVFNKPLSQRDKAWEDDIYVNSTSTVGPNTVDIMEWLIGKYTNFTTDSTSFNYVKTRLEEYPSDFPILERKNVLTVLREIAFQCRCAIYLRDGVFYLKYLPEEPTSVATITEDDIKAETLEQFHTDTEDIVTKLVANWRRDYSKEEDNRIILRHNVKKYGLQEEDFDFYIYNELPYVHKSATFWILRKSNTWKQLRFSTPLHLFKLETFDGVTIDLDSFSDSNIKCYMTKADYNSDDNRLDFEIWTPVRSGETTAYDFAYPADIEETLEWPTEDDRNLGNIGSGDAPGFDTQAPTGHPLSQQPSGLQGFQIGPCPSQGGYSPSAEYTPTWSDQTCGGGNGDTFPSDAGDYKVEKTDQSGAAPDDPTDPGEIQTDLNADLLFDKSYQQFQDERLSDLEANTLANTVVSNHAAEGNTDGTGNETADDEFEKLPEPDEVDNGCITVQAHVYQGSYFTQGGVGNGNGGAMVSGPQVATLELTFKTCCEGNAYVNAIRARHDARQAAESYTNGESAVINAIGFCSCSPGEEPTYDEPTQPTPIAYKKTPASGYEDEAAAFDGAADFNDEDLEMDDCGG